MEQYDFYHVEESGEVWEVGSAMLSPEELALLARLIKKGLLPTLRIDQEPVDDDCERFETIRENPIFFPRRQKEFALWESLGRKYPTFKGKT